MPENTHISQRRSEYEKDGQNSHNVCGIQEFLEI
jgi:hypothetical protein